MMILVRSMLHLSVTPDLFRGPGATRESLSLEPWTPE